MARLSSVARTAGTLLALSGAASAQFTVATGKLLSLPRLPAGPRFLAGDAAGRPQVAEGYGKLPLAFEPNLGQTDARVRFLARGGGMTAFFTDTEAVHAAQPGERRDPKALPHERRQAAKSSRQWCG